MLFKDIGYFLTRKNTVTKRRDNLKFTGVQLCLIPFAYRILKLFSVGSGTAGSLIAHRLAKETNFSIIVLEAGTKGNSLLDIPVVGPLLHGSLYDWQFESVPQEHGCFAMKDRVRET